MIAIEINFNIISWNDTIITYRKAMNNFSQHHNYNSAQKQKVPPSIVY